jgi:N-acetylglucosaminyldiphosphoundecaprenol N-acetyl-beta-D-mannosaminyltransferase
MKLKTSEFTTTPILGYNVFSGSIETIGTTKKTVVDTINQYSYCIAERDEEFKNSLKNADVLLPDGVGIVAAAKFLRGERIRKIAGADLHLHLLTEMNKKDGSCFYLGSSQTTIDKIKKKLQKEFPNIRMEGYSPPFSAEFSLRDNQKMIKAVNSFNPDVLFVGMTAPKQEKWVESQKEFLKSKMICSIGAVFDFYAGTKKRPGKLWVKLGVEWLGRLFTEPARMSKRYLYYGPIFIYYIFFKGKT